MDEWKLMISIREKVCHDIEGIEAIEEAFRTLSLMSIEH